MSGWIERLKGRARAFVPRRGTTAQIRSSNKMIDHELLLDTDKLALVIAKPSANKTVTMEREGYLHGQELPLLASLLKPMTLVRDPQTGWQWFDVNEAPAALEQAMQELEGDVESVVDGMATLQQQQETLETSLRSEQQSLAQGLADNAQQIEANRMEAETLGRKQQQHSGAIDKNTQDIASVRDDLEQTTNADRARLDSAEQNIGQLQTGQQALSGGLTEVQNTIEGFAFFGIEHDPQASSEERYASAKAVNSVWQFVQQLSSLLQSDNASLDTLQELVDYVEVNRSTLENLSIASIAGLQSALEGKMAVGATLNMQQIDGLLAALQSKRDTGTAIAQDEVTGLVAALQSKRDKSELLQISDVEGLYEALVAASGGGDGTSVLLPLPMNQVDGLMDVLAGLMKKTDPIAPERVTGLAEALADKLSKGAEIAMAKVTGLTEELAKYRTKDAKILLSEIDGFMEAFRQKASKSDLEQGLVAKRDKGDIPQNEVTGLVEALEGKRNAGAVPLSDVSGLGDALAGKRDKGEVLISEVSGLSAALGSKRGKSDKIPLADVEQLPQQLEQVNNKTEGNANLIGAITSELEALKKKESEIPLYSSLALHSHAGPTDSRSGYRDSDNKYAIHSTSLIVDVGQMDQGEWLKKSQYCHRSQLVMRQSTANGSGASAPLGELEPKALFGSMPVAEPYQLYNITNTTRNFKVVHDVKSGHSYYVTHTYKRGDSAFKYLVYFRVETEWRDNGYVPTSSAYAEQYYFKRPTSLRHIELGSDLSETCNLSARPDDVFMVCFDGILLVFGKANASRQDWNMAAFNLATGEVVSFIESVQGFFHYTHISAINDTFVVDQYGNSINYRNGQHNSIKSTGRVRYGWFEPNTNIITSIDWPASGTDRPTFIREEINPANCSVTELSRHQGSNRYDSKTSLSVVGFTRVSNYFFVTYRYYQNNTYTTDTALVDATSFQHLRPVANFPSSSLGMTTIWQEEDDERVVAVIAGIAGTNAMALVEIDKGNMNPLRMQDVWPFDRPSSAFRSNHYGELFLDVSKGLIGVHYSDRSRMYLYNIALGLNAPSGSGYWLTRIK